MTAILDAQGIRLHRAGTGPAVVLLHPLGVDHRVWDFTVSRLRQRFTLLRYDFPGHGATPVPPGAYGIADLSTQLGALLAREGVSRAHVVGMSLGGLVAQHFAASAPQQVARLVLVDTTPRYPDEMRQMWAQRAAAARSAGVASLTEGLLAIWFTAAGVAQDGPAVRFVRECLARCPAEGYALACEALGNADVRALVPSIQAPTLVVCGDEDLPSFHEAAHWLSSTIPGARLEWLAPGRHAAMLEQPEAFVKLLEGFLG